MLLYSYIKQAGDALYILRKHYTLTHAGMVPGYVQGTSVIWGLRYSEGGILYIIDGELMSRTTRFVWETLTDFAPPWPWSCDDLLDLQSSTHKPRRT